MKAKRNYRVSRTSSIDDPVPYIRISGKWLRDYGFDIGDEYVVEPSFIRVDADEVTYGLHVILRFELEKMIIEDNVQVDELPGLWNEKMEELFVVVGGVIPIRDIQKLKDLGVHGVFPGGTPFEEMTASIKSLF